MDFSLMNEEQLAIAVAELRQRETMLQRLMEVEASQLGALLVHEEQVAQRSPKKTKRKKR